nr:MAG TPA_asm: hypothetical protein [Caudoviricetes sp.]
MFISSVRVGCIYLFMTMGSSLTFFFPDKSWLIIPCLSILMGFQRVNRA